MANFRYRHHSKRAFLGCVSMYLTQNMNWASFLAWKANPSHTETERMAAAMAIRAKNAYDFITVPPVSEKRLSEDNHCTSMLAQMVAGKLSLPFIRVFKKRVGFTHGSRFQSLTQPAPELRDDFDPAAGKVCLLIDDVITTGKTMSNCFDSLVALGIHVDGLVWCFVTKIRG